MLGKCIVKEYILKGFAADKAENYTFRD